MDSKFLLGFETDLDNIDNEDLMATFLAMNAKDFCKKAKKDRQTSCKNEKKQNNLVEKIFDYIYVA